MQQEALGSALADVFWKAGGNESCTVCLPHQTETYVQTSELFNEDGVTEKVRTSSLIIYYGSYETDSLICICSCCSFT